MLKDIGDPAIAAGFFILLIMSLLDSVNVTSYIRPIAKSKVIIVMGLFDKIFKGKEKPIHNYDDFWSWFQLHAAEFYKVVKSGNQIEEKFLNKISPKLEQINDGFWFLTGMLNETTAELIITADGSIQHIVFVEELIAEAPALEGWKFTALKPALDIADTKIEMDGYEFSQENLYFYSNELPEYPDEIEIVITSDDLSEENHATINNGVMIFLDNYLGELDFALNIDHVDVIARKEASQELIPISKLKDYLTWRQKEFNEKYEGLRHSTENDNYAAMEATLPNGRPAIAIINTDLLAWDRKASHPWVAIVELAYNGDDNNGLPDKETYAQLDDKEDLLTRQLIDAEGYLNIGRNTADNVRKIYFACNDFRKPAKVFHQLQKENDTKLLITYDIYKDKYWKTFNRFSRSL